MKNQVKSLARTVWEVFKFEAVCKLFAILLYLNLEGKVQLKPVLKLLLIAVLSVAGIVLLFQVAFSVPMP